MENIRWINVATTGGSAPPPPPPPPGSPGGTCFLPDQLVLMANGTWKRIVEIMPGEWVQGRWGQNQVRGIEKPLLGDRDMWLINDKCFNTWDHPTWTQDGWAVVDYQAYVENDWQKGFELHDNAGTVWVEKYQPCDPSDMNEMVRGVTMLAVPMAGFERLETLEPHKYPEDTQLYALALTGDRTMYVDGYCFSGWADVDKVDYQARIGT